MRRAVVAIGLLLVLTTSTARADADLTSIVNVAYPPRTSEATLHEIAHQRAVEIASDFSHNGQRDGTAEVLAWNSGFDDPVTNVLNQWLRSPEHDAILTNPVYTKIGCGSYTTDDGRYFAACVLTAPQSAESVGTARSPKPTPAGSTPASGATTVIPAPPAGTAPALLPDTAAP